MALAPFSSVDELLSALESIDGLPTEDMVAALPHLLQTAEGLEAEHGDDPELVAAGLVHDLASALELGCPDHAAAGAAIVAPLLGRRVAELVAGHAEAKRYLVTVDPGYADGLSANSTFTLVGQGGTMDTDEVAAFACRAEVAALVALRRADDAAKLPDAPTRSVDAWRPLLEHVATITTTLPVSPASPTRSSG
jgi:predicted HD phosphohydrolase